MNYTFYNETKLSHVRWIIWVNHVNREENGNWFLLMINRMRLKFWRKCREWWVGAALSPGSSALTDLYWAPLGILIDGSDLSWGCLGQDDTVALYSVITVVKVDDNKPCKYFLCDQGGGRRTQANWQLRHQTGHRFYSNLLCVCVWEREIKRELYWNVSHWLLYRSQVVCDVLYKIWSKTVTMLVVAGGGGGWS